MWQVDGNVTIMFAWQFFDMKWQLGVFVWQVDDEVLLQLVRQMSQLTVINYYGELLESDT